MRNSRKKWGVLLFISAMVTGALAQPSNDLCTNVIVQELLIGGTLNLTGDNTGATAAGDGSPGSIIGDSNLPTVWHAFTINSCSNIVLEYCGTAPPFENYWNLLSADCPSSTSINATTVDDMSCGNGNRTLVFDGLMAGTYYVPVLSDLFNNAVGPYQIQLSAFVCTGGTPPNDLCGAVPTDTLHVGSSVGFSGDNTGATATGDGMPGSIIGDSNLPTVWHAFYLPSCSKVVVEYCGTFPSFGNFWNLLSADCPSTNSYNPVSINDTDCADDNRTLIYDGLSVGTYYLPVLADAFNNAEGPYQINVSALVCAGGVPPNDLCSNVPTDTLNVGASVGFFGDNTGATATGDGLPGSIIGDSNLPTVWHSFYLPTCSKVIVEYCGTNPTFGNYWNLLSADCPSLNSYNPISTNDTDCADGNRTMIYDGLTTGTYYLPVLTDPFNAAEGPYQINVSALVCTGGVPPNDLCTDITPVDLQLAATIEFFGDNSGATSIDDGVPGSTIGDSNLPTVWHAFTLSSCADVSVTYCGTDPVFGNHWDLLALDCPADASISAASANVLDCTDGNRTIYFDSLVAGTYYVPVLYDPFNDAAGPYQVQVSAFPCEIISTVETIDEDTWSVYPNPNGGTINIVSSRSGVHSIEIMDLRGVLIYQKETQIIAGNRIELALRDAFASGTYILMISNTETRYFQKIIFE